MYSKYILLLDRCTVVTVCSLTDVQVRTVCSLADVQVRTVCSLADVQLIYSKGKDSTGCSLNIVFFLKIL